MGKNDLDKKNFLLKLNSRGELKEINQDVPINQQMSLEEYREQVFLWMMLKGGYSIQATKDSMELYWNDFQEFYDDNLSLAAAGSGMSMRYL